EASPSVAKTSGRVERVLARPDGSALYRGNNLDALRLLAAPMREKVTLAYMDPPFWTGRVFETRDQRVAFEDRWSDRAAYLESLGARLQVRRGMLPDHGCAAC